MVHSDLARRARRRRLRRARFGTDGGFLVRGLPRTFRVRLLVAAPPPTLRPPRGGGTALGRRRESEESELSSFCVCIFCRTSGTLVVSGDGGDGGDGDAATGVPPGSSATSTTSGPGDATRVSSASASSASCTAAASSSASKASSPISASGEIFTLAYNGSVCSDIGQGVSTVAFHFHMYGYHIGELRLTDAAGEAVWSLSGDQGPEWQAVSVGVYSATFAFEYRRRDGTRGDAAVAQVSVSCGNAPPSSPHPTSPHPITPSSTV